MAALTVLFSVNNGPGESLTKLLDVMGCKIQTGSRVAKTLKKEQDISTAKKIVCENFKIQT